VLASACSSAGVRADGGKITSHSADISLFVTAELKGTLEPCGCTSNPLGDIARTAEVIAEARKERPTALLDGGSTLYTEIPVPAAKRAQEELKADLIARLLPTLGLAAAGLGPNDLPAPRFPRQAANVSAGAPTEPPRVVDVGGARVGVFGVVDPDAVPGVTAGDPAPAAQKAVAQLRAKGAQVVVGLAAMGRPAAKRLARAAPGIDLLVVGHDVPEPPAPAPETVGATTLVAPANRGQVLTRIDLHVDAAGGPLTDAVGPERAAAEGRILDERIARLAADVAKWEQDPGAEQAFVEKNRAELARMRRERQALADQPLRAPAQGSWFVIRAVPIARRMACDPAVVAEKQALDRAVGAANLAAAKDEKPAAPAAGQPGYSGIEECGSCHEKQVAFWRTTRHAHAWATLEEIGKPLDRDCIGCHLTGWQAPGGATLAVNQNLRDVQCEACHGPSSLHVDSDGGKRKTIARQPAADLCASRCHTPEHSDTFQLEAYLRDVTGAGHGEKLRAKLGDGPTGHALRGAALEAAGRDVGAHCPR
jgi:hypothetical protein